MDIKIGDRVKFRDGLYKDEERTMYIVREINGNRSVLELIYPSMMIRLQSIALVCDLEVLDTEGRTYEGKMAF